jgi:hypothetical protein
MPKCEPGELFKMEANRDDHSSILPPKHSLNRNWLTWQCRRHSHRSNWNSLLSAKPKTVFSIAGWPSHFVIIVVLQQTAEIMFGTMSLQVYVRAILSWMMWTLFLWTCKWRIRRLLLRWTYLLRQFWVSRLIPSIWSFRWVGRSTH